jgi:hypothetical protein
MYQMLHFHPEEVLPKSWLDDYGGNALLAMDERILMSIDAIREYFAVPVVINNWAAGGSYMYRGLRTQNCQQYTPNSQHSFGRAIDFDVMGETANYVRGIILSNRARWPLITAVELNVDWIHIDSRDGTGNSDIILFSK